jgi:polyisoprenoid-binding protein YceI
VKRMIQIACCVLLAAAAGTVYAADYKVDPVHSATVFNVNHLGAGQTYGMIPGISGTLSFDESDLSSCSIDIEVDAATLSTFNQARDNHLSGPDFFNAKQFPKITFKSNSWTKNDDGTYDITGDFTLLGVTKEITVTAEHVGYGKNPRSGDDLTGFESTFTIDRTDFGMNYGVAETGGVGKDVEIIISIEAIKQ